MNARLPVALTLCAAMLIAVPAASPASGASAAAKKTCKKVKGKKRCKVAKKKKVASNVPADGSYNASDGSLNIGVGTTAGKRTVAVRVSIPLTCTPSGVTQSRTLAIVNLPLTGVGFSGKSDQDPSYGFGVTTVTGTFLSATRVHVAAQNTGYQNGPEVCSGSVDVTVNIQKGH